MSNDSPSLAVISAVYLGAVILIGLPATYALFWLFGTLLEVANLDWIVASAAGALFFLAVSLLIGLQLAVEAAALQLGGIPALYRGSRRTTIVRFATLSAGVFVALVGVFWVGLSTAFAVDGPETLVPGLLLALAVLAVLYRGLRAFVTGLQTGHT